MKFIKLVAAIVIAIFISMCGLLTMCSLSYVSHQEETRDRLSELSIEGLTQEQKRNYYYVTGKIVNNGTEPVTFVKIGVDYLDSEGSVIETDNTYAVGSQSLTSGSSKPFTIMTKLSPSMEQFEELSCYIMND